MLYSLLDFIERFGATTQKIGGRAPGSIRSRTTPGCISTKSSKQLSTERVTCSNFSQGSRRKPVKLKEGGLLWVYAIERTAVSEVFAVVAFATWSLMVRRRLYREVGMTKSSL